MAEKNQEADKEPEITPVGPGVDEEVRDESDEQEVSREAEAEDEEDERVGRSEDDREDDEGEGQERKRSKRRLERKRRRERERNDRVELNFLRQRNEQLERKFSQVDARLEQTDIGNIDTRIAQLDSQIAEAENLYADAITKRSGEAAKEAMQIRDQLRDSRSQLVNAKDSRIQSARQRQAQPEQQLDPVVARNVQTWLAENNDWFDPNLRDEDSRIARAIEDALYSEGRLDARTPEYWDEYERRLRKRGVGPYRQKTNGRDRDDEDEDQDEEDEREEERDERPRRKARGPRITTGGRDRPLKKGEVYISADRREAMEKAGVWDNPTLRARYLRRYAQYDAEHRNDNRRR